MENVFIIEPLIDKSLDPNPIVEEAISLVKSAGGFVKGYECVRITKITPSTYIGRGKVEEIALACDELKCNLVLFDGDLSPSQVVNLLEALGGIRVIDRTTLILDIFALSAKTAEGKVQVELAQLNYIYPRLKGKGAALSRLGAGIGTRGPGESKLETDRRHIRRRIDYLENRLAELKAKRLLQKNRREKDQTLLVSLVGYTNAGKSTLLNALTGSEVLAEDKLFATLDPTSRKLDLGDFSLLLVDTVGFIKNVPTTLIEAFASTLESAVEADLNLIVVDARSEWREQLDTTEKMLEQLGSTAKRLIVFNKCDLVIDYSEFPKDALFISAKDGKGLDGLKNALKDAFKSEYAFYEFNVPYSKAGTLKELLSYCSNSHVVYGEEYISVRCVIKKNRSAKIEDFIKELK